MLLHPVFRTRRQHPEQLCRPLGGMLPAVGEQVSIAPLCAMSVVFLILGANVIDLTSSSKELYEGQELVAVETPLVKSLGWSIRRGHQKAPMPPEAAEKPAKEHRVGNVGDLELVQAEHRRLRCDLPPDVPQRVTGHPSLWNQPAKAFGQQQSEPLQLPRDSHLRGLVLPPLVASLVDVQHEVVEVRPPAVPSVRRQDVHQQRFPHTDVAEEVEALGPLQRQVPPNIAAISLVQLPRRLLLPRIRQQPPRSHQAA
mmetsp:Transcript_18406/g.69647  ORF Transcript_18406/g.69647 Transcript_18406/m.69647 type:complete len:255 (-) Transcript_18406:78-842(-)|eukprot:scaffold2456_cov238-Pinguiococcus_pyrenoidosus.AAC.2